MHTSASPYPLRLTGELADQPSRWLWLVKWLLVIPHVIVLFFLTLGFGGARGIPFFPILSPGRSRGGLFDSNVGVLRWGGRVGFYSYAALGPDVSPPFTLRDV